MAEEYPVYSISIPSQVQGFSIKGDTIMLSRSWGLETSTLEFYDGMKESGKTISVSGREVPLYYLDSTNHQKTVKLPCFSEELCVVGDRVYISFESACDKYVVGKFFFANINCFFNVILKQKKSLFFRKTLIIQIAPNPNGELSF